MAEEPKLVKRPVHTLQAEADVELTNQKARFWATLANTLKEACPIILKKLREAAEEK